MGNRQQRPSVKDVMECVGRRTQKAEVSVLEALDDARRERDEQLMERLRR